MDFYKPQGSKYVIKMKPTLGPEVCRYYLPWAIRIRREGRAFLEAVEVAFFGGTCETAGSRLDFCLLHVD